MERVDKEIRERNEKKARREVEYMKRIYIKQKEPEEREDMEIRKIKKYMERMEKFSELSSSSSEKHLITHLNPTYDNNNLEHYKILYKAVLDNLLKLHILKIDRDKKKIAFDLMDSERNFLI